MNKENNIYVVTAPSGTGKTTLNRRLVENVPTIKISTSHTTRKMRGAEVQGDHYWFVSEEDFLSMVKRNELLEWAKVFHNFYGTSLKCVNDLLSKDYKVILEIDVQGFENVRNKIPTAQSIFILPPSIKALKERLMTRGTDHPETQKNRILCAKEELKKAYLYNHIIINDDLEATYIQLRDLFLFQKPFELQKDEALAHIEKLILEFESLEFETGI